MADLAPSRRILFVSESAQLAEPVVHILRSAGHEVIEAKTPLEAKTWLRIHRADLAIADLEMSDPTRAQQTTDLIGRLRDEGRRNVLVLARAKGDSHLRELFERGKLFNFLTVGDDERVDPVELSVTVAKILTGDIFGIDPYLGPDPKRMEFVVRESRQKSEVVDAAEAFAREVGCHPRVAQGVAVAVDELLTNAVYNAPVDKEGKPRFSHLPRTVPVTLEPGEEVTLRFAFDGRRLALSSTDNFGSLPPERVVSYLAKCFARGEDQIDSKQGGAGLGLYALFNLLHQFVINVAPGKRTEAVGLIEVTRSYKEFAARAKSFNVFVAERV